jgi:hypothetical protein
MQVFCQILTKIDPECFILNNRLWIFYPRIMAE